VSGSLGVATASAGEPFGPSTGLASATACLPSVTSGLISVTGGVVSATGDFVAEAGPVLAGSATGAGSTICWPSQMNAPAASRRKTKSPISSITSATVTIIPEEVLILPGSNPALLACALICSNTISERL